MTPRISNPTGRSTPAHVVTLDDGTHLYFSYETCIAQRYFKDGDAVYERVANVWGPTTGRHFNEMGLRDWPVVETLTTLGETK